MAKFAMISQPMAGKTHEEIMDTRNRAVEYLTAHGFTVVDSYFHGGNEPVMPETIENKPLFYLAKSIEMMSGCETLYCCDGWDLSRGCIIEHECAADYGLEIIYEERDEKL